MFTTAGEACFTSGAKPNAISARDAGTFVSDIAGVATARDSIMKRARIIAGS
jgi:hypothetical protein